MNQGNSFQRDPYSSPGSLSLGETWSKALTQPNVSSYEEIAGDENASASRAYQWIALSSVVSVLISSLIQAAFGTNILPEELDDFAALSFGFSLVCGVIIVPIITVISFAVFTAITQLIAGALVGTGSYEKLAYTWAAYLAPLSLINGVLSGIPYVNCLAIPLGIYGLVLNVIAVKAVNQFDWGKAVISSLAVLFGIFVLVAVCVIVILAVLGPAIGTVFSNIIQELGTPVP